MRVNVGLRPFAFFPKEEEEKGGKIKVRMKEGRREEGGREKSECRAAAFRFLPEGGRGEKGEDQGENEGRREVGREGGR